jgi:DNA-binding response OmpR family regulator
VPNHIQALDEGADACLAKPFVWAELMARLRALFRRRQQVRSSSQRVGDLEIDPSSRNVKRAGKAITLTPREFSLLQLLVRHRGHVVTRSQIREHLYQKFDDGASNVIDVYIRYLRSKIDKGFDKPLILTRWGEGYLLRADPN